jgi:hypothetical protein
MCKESQRFVTPKERVLELASQWREAKKNMGVKKVEARTKSLRKMRRIHQEKHAPHGVGSDVSKEHALDQALIVLTSKEYSTYKLIVAQNQVKLKQWGNIATCNFAHQVLLIEVRRLSSLNVVLHVHVLATHPVLTHYHYHAKVERAWVDE